MMSVKKVSKVIVHVRLFFFFLSLFLLYMDYRNSELDFVSYINRSIIRKDRNPNPLHLVLITGLYLIHSIVQYCIFKTLRSKNSSQRMQLAKHRKRITTKKLF